MLKMSVFMVISCFRLTSEDVLRQLNETSKCIFHENRVVCSQELLQELLNKKPLWLEWSNFTEMLTTLIVRYPTKVSNSF